MATLLITACASYTTDGSTAPANLTYANPSPVYDTCAAISANVPTVGGGAVASYAITPPLPAGLAIDAASGVISGTPTEAIAATTFTVTAANADGETTVDLLIQVDSTAPAGISYGGATLAQLVDLSATWTPTLTSGAASTWTVTVGTLPTGLVLDVDTGEITGKPTELGTWSVTIEADNCEALPTTVDIDIEVEPWYASSMYITSNTGLGTGATVSSALWDETLGALRSTGRAPATGGGLTGATLHPDGTTLYAADSGVPGITLFQLDAVDGHVVDFATTTTLPQRPNDLAITPDGAFLYACCSNGNVYMFAIDPTDHSLAPLSPASIVEGSAAWDMAMHPDGGWLVVLDSTDLLLRSFAIDALTGELTATASAASGNNPQDVAVSPNGNFLYLTSVSYAEIRGYSLDLVTGAITTLANSPYSTASTTGYFDAAFHPTGEYVYFPSILAGRVLQCTADSVTGDLALMSTNYLDLDDVAYGIAVEPRGERVYVTMANDTIQVLDIGVDGSLARAAEPILFSHPGATDMVFSSTSTPHTLVADALYAVSYTDDVIYNFDLDAGALTAMTNPFVDNGGENPEALTVLWMTNRVYDMEPTFTGQALTNLYTPDAATNELVYDFWLAHTSPTWSFAVEPTERFGYGVSDAGIVVTSFDGAGNWVTGMVAPLTQHPDEIAVHPGGAYLLATDAAANTLACYSISPYSGSLVLTSLQSTGTEPLEALVTPSGRFVYAACGSGGEIDMYVLTSGGALTSLASLPPTISVGYTDAALSPDGRFLAVASTSGGIEMFRVNTDENDLIEDGSLTQLGAGTTTAQDPMTLEFDPSGAFLYVGLNATGIQVFGVDGAGALDALGVVTSGDGAFDLALHLAVQ